jgi:ferrochelatase
MGEKSQIKRAVVLLNLGGPTSMDEVRPFLFSLFYDPAIISLPNPFRYLLAKLISSTRYKEASHIYAELGGKSPLLEETQKQAADLSKLFEGDNNRVFVAMRHATPRTEETFAEVRAWDPDEVILLPLYPQFSITTTGSAIEAWRALEDKHNWHPHTQAVCCYPTLEGFIDPIVNGISPEAN